MSKLKENIYQRKDGRWEGRYTKDYCDGKRRYGYIYGRTREEVESKLADYDDCEDGEPMDVLINMPGTFGAIALEWLSFMKPQLRASSYNKYLSDVNTYLLSQFGPIPIQDIYRTDVADFITKMLSNKKEGGLGLSPKTTSGVYSVIRSIFRYASQQQKISVDQIEDIPIRQSIRTLRVLSIKEESVLFDYLFADLTPTNLVILLASSTGIRIGEACALQWRDINHRDGILSITKSMQRLRVPDPNAIRKTRIVIEAPKSECSIRNIPLPDDIIEILESKRRDDDAYLLTGKVNIFVEPRTLQRRFSIILARLGIQGATFHTLRHTFATRAVETDFDIKSLSEILGHASVNITMNRYVHPSMECKRRHMNNLSRIRASYRANIDVYDTSI